MRRHSLRRLVLAGALVMPSALCTSGAHESVSVAKSLGPPSRLPARAGSPIPAVFVGNEGELDARVHYYSRARHQATFATDAGVTLAFDDGPGHRLALRLGFVGAAGSHVEATSPDGAHVNYFIGRDPRRWRTNQPTYHDVIYRDVWPGIDAVFTVAADGLEYEFRVRPGADPSRIRLHYAGATSLSVDNDGALQIATDSRTVLDAAPRAFQSSGGRPTPVPVRYVVGKNAEFAFALGVSDRTLPLVIDPTIAYASYLGGSSGEAAEGVAVDSAGNAYVVGSTGSIDFPVTPDAFQTVLGDADPRDNTRLDVFVAKVSADGSRLIYATYLGGYNEDFGRAIAVDVEGNAYVTGSTYARDFPTTPGAFQRVSSGYAAFITKLDQTGSSLVYSTYYGSGDAGGAIAVDGTGRAYVAGGTTNPHLPGMESGFSGPGPPTGYQQDGFLIRLSADGSAIEYGTYISGSGADSAAAIAVLGTRAFVAGSTNSYDFPTTEGAFDTSSGSALLRTPDGGTIWQDAGVPDLSIAAFAQDPTDPDVIYAAGGRGVYKSYDAGGSFDLLAAPLWYYDVIQMAVDPAAPNVVYLTTYYSGLFKSVDGGATWSMASGGSFFESDMTVDRTGAVLIAAYSSVRKSFDGGASWRTLLLNGNCGFRAVFVDPSDPNLILAGGACRDGSYNFVATIFRSTDGGAGWTELPRQFSGATGVFKIRKDSTHGTIYAAGMPRMWKSADGVSFTPLQGFDGVRTVDFAIDSSIDPPAIYTEAQGQILKRSLDGGETVSDVLVNGSVLSVLAVAVIGPSTLMLGERAPAHAFVMAVETSETGADSLVYSTLLKGTGWDSAAGLAVDTFGQVYLAGLTGSGDFPLTVADAPRVTPGRNAFVVKLTADAAQLFYATQFGSTEGAWAQALAIDRRGSAYIVGTIDGRPSTDFVAKLPPDGGSFDVLPIPGTWAGYYGGIAVDARGAAYVVGGANSTEFPATENSFQPRFAGGWNPYFLGDAFIAKVTFDSAASVSQ